MTMTQDIGMVILLKSRHNSAPPLKQGLSSTCTPCFLWLMNIWNFVDYMDQLVGVGGGGGGWLLLTPQLVGFRSFSETVRTDSRHG